MCLIRRKARERERNKTTSKSSSVKERETKEKEQDLSPIRVCLDSRGEAGRATSELELIQRAEAIWLYARTRREKKKKKKKENGL